MSSRMARPRPCRRSRPSAFDALNAALKAAGEDHAAAHPGAAGRGRADGLRPHRDPAPVAAAHLAPPEAAGRGRPGRALPRRRLGVLPPGRARRRRRRWRASLIARLDPRRSDRRARPRAARRRARGARRGGAGLFPRPCGRMGPHPPSCTSPTRRWRRRSREALADRPFRSLLDLGTGTGRMLELFGPAHRARPRHRPLARHAGARARAARTRRACAIAACARATSTTCALPPQIFDVVHRASGAALPRRRRARDRARPRACCARAAGCWSSTSRRTISNSCARSTRIAGSASRPRRWRNG